ncbi:TlpA family protein disulfide reductase [Streptomyces sp. YIM S03343]
MGESALSGCAKLPCMTRCRVSSIALLTALAAVGGLSLSACGSGKSHDFPIDSSTDADGISILPKNERQLPNDLKGTTLQGKKLNIATFKGKVVVINVWGSWCPPCRAEAPHFEEVAQETANKGVAFAGVDTRENNRSAAIAFEKDYGIKYPSLYDPTGRIVLFGFPKGASNPQTIPSTIVLDRDGRIAARALEPLSTENIHKMIDPLIAEK